MQTTQEPGTARLVDPVEHGRMSAAHRYHEVVELVGTGRAAAPQRWTEGATVHDEALQCRGGDVDWICGDCGAAVLTGIRRPETLRTIEVRCPACRRYQRRDA